jgi:ComEC/Rec2-related protein
LNISSTKFSRFPLLWIATFFAAGIYFSHLVSVVSQIYLIVVVSCAAGLIIFRNNKCSTLFLAAAFGFAGALCFQIQSDNISPDRIRILYDSGKVRSGEPVEAEGIIASKPETSNDGSFLILETKKLFRGEQGINTSGKIRIFVPAENAEAAADFQRRELNYGSVVTAACDLMREEKFRNPGVVSRIEILDRQGIDATCTVKTSSLIRKIGEQSVWRPTGWVFDRRQDLIDEFRQRFSGPTAGIMIASLLGDKHFLDKDTADVFREGGTFHVLVISGLHITFIGGLLLLFVRLFTRNKVCQVLIASGILWIYTFAVGAEVPVVRASIMFTVLAFSQVVRRQGSLLNSLGLCALILLAWKPDDLFSASFQLTFTSVTAIAAAGFPLIEQLRAIGKWSPSAEKPFPPRISVWLRCFCEMLYWRDAAWEIETRRQIWSAKIFKRPYLKWLGTNSLQSGAAYLLEGILVSVVVQVWLLPFVVVYFHRITPVGIILNLWVGICLALESFAAVIAVLLGQVSSLLALPFVKLTELFNLLLLELPRIFVDGSLSSFRLPAYTGWGRTIYFIYFVLVIFLTAALYRWKPFEYRVKVSEADDSLTFFRASPVLFATALSLIVLLSVIIVHPFSSPAPDGRLHIDCLDVGQGDSALVTFPNGETMLVDGGGSITFHNDNDDQPPFEPDAPRIGEAVVSEFLWEKGYSRIDFILATHADADHIQGLTDVARNFSVKNALFARTPISNPEYAELAQVIQKKKIPVSLLSRGDALSIGGVNIEVLSPRKILIPTRFRITTIRWFCGLFTAYVAFCLPVTLSAGPKTECWRHPNFYRRML